MSTGLHARPPAVVSSRALLSLLVAIGLGACTVLGPDYTPSPTPPLPAEWNAEEREQQSQQLARWWTLFNDPVLDQLVELGAAQNLSVQAAGLRIVQARAALGIADALVFPQQQQVSGSTGKLYQNEQSFNSAGIGLDVGWEMDVWGKYARGIESSEATLYASIASYHDVMVTISAEIVRNYIAYRTAQERIYLSQQNIAIQQRVVEMTQTQYDSGNVSELDVQQAKTQLFATQATLPGLNSVRLQSAHALATLLGLLPDDVYTLLVLPETAGSGAASSTGKNRVNDKDSGISVSEYQRDSIIPSAPELSTDINPDLVMRRPDLKVAEMQTRAQSARIGLAQTELYPQFFLFGSIGLSDTSPSGGSLSISNAVNAAIGPGFSWNIFAYDRIKNQVRIEDARFQESLTNYNQQVLNAIGEVSNALVSYAFSKQQAALNLAAVESSVRAFNISATQYNNGLVSYQRLLSTVEKMTLREDTYAQSRGEIAYSVVALYKALGGGWQDFTGRPVIPTETIEVMKKRTDWGDYLAPEAIIAKDRHEPNTP